MNFVSTTDFDVIPFSLPNIDKSKSLFDKYVTALQDEELRKVFGTYFYDTMQSALDAMPEWKTKTAYAVNDIVSYGNNVFKALQIVLVTNVTPPVDGAIWELTETDNRWLLLKNGATYTYYDRPYKWEGMNKAVKGLVYAYWIRDKHNDTLTEVGNVQSKVENGELISMAQRQVRGFNKFVDILCGDENVAHYIYCYPWLRQNSLIGYLWVNSDSFADLFNIGGIVWGDLQEYLISQFKSPKKWNTFNI